MKSFEANFDGLVGPTHNYAGLSTGNVASKLSANEISSPKNAALQGIAKMKALHDMGMTQGVFAPQERPDILSLRRLGFSGSDAKVLEQAHKDAPNVLSACFSASSMWTANSSTVSPSGDSKDSKVHFTPANLTNKFHRSLEPEITGNILKAVFNDEKHFNHHLHLNENDHFGDEGAANHTRLCTEYGERGVEIFTFGKYAFDQSKPAPTKFPARQTLEASQAVARLHGLSDDKVVFVQQNPDVIDQGVFHNDVISVGNQNVLFYHEQAFLHTDKFIAEVQSKFGSDDLHFIKATTDEVSLDDCVKTYLFNTQIITLPDGPGGKEMAIIAPMHCYHNPRVKAYLDRLVTLNTPIKQVKYFDVNESMKNGGGPACLRLRVALNETELKAVNQHCLMSDELFANLNAWVNTHYREELHFDDLRDPSLLMESRTALDQLTQMLKLGSVYHFQQA
ncbi:N-succinylarginine dihydrolase [Thalassotalea sp. 42_200_T64]|nr:N-succinylarginine dihydrolase [Thalassotalea sp. 42_200_T64]